LFSASGGRLVLNRAAVTLMGLTPGSKVAMVQDRKDPDNWYLRIDPDGYSLYAMGQGREDLAFSNANLKRMVLDYFGRGPRDNFRLLVAGEPTTIGKCRYYGLLNPGYDRL
jgi:hypothetical protein